MQPAAFVAGLRRLSGAHFHATATFRVSAAGAPDAGGRDAITTTTDLWIDKQGNFRLAESNDQDGGREVVRVGSELAVGLRYGKLIRRPAQDPEPQRFLEEAVGAPSAAWDTVGRFAELVPAGNRAFRLTRLRSRARRRPRPRLCASGVRRSTSRAWWATLGSMPGAGCRPFRSLRVSGPCATGPPSRVR